LTEVDVAGQKKTTVYSYWTWSREEGLGHIASDKRTRIKIEMARDLIIPGTDQEVDEVDIDEDGSYSG